MQEKLSDILRYAKSAGKNIIAKIKKGEDMDENMNIKSYDGDDAVYSGSDEEYKEFLKSVDGKMNTQNEAEPVENTQKINLSETINIQGVIDKVKQKAVELGEAAKSVKDDVAGKIEDFKDATADKDGDSDGETRFEKFFSGKKEAIKNIDVDGIKDQITGGIRNSKEKLGDLKEGLTSITERFDETNEKVAQISEQFGTLSDKIGEIAEKLQAGEISDMEYKRESAQNNADLRYSISEIGDGITEIKQAVVGVSKLNDSIFELKNAQINTKNSVAELEAGFAKLKKKCVAGVTILSILSAIIIALEVFQLIS